MGPLASGALASYEPGTIYDDVHSVLNTRTIYFVIGQICHRPLANMKKSHGFLRYALVIDVNYESVRQSKPCRGASAFRILDQIKYFLYDCSITANTLLWNGAARGRL
jgi:hypothetical protein